MPKDEKVEVQAQGAGNSKSEENKSEQKEKKAPNIYIKDELEKEFVRDIFVLGKPIFLESYKDNASALKMAERIVNNIQESIEKAVSNK